MNEQPNIKYYADKTTNRLVYEINWDNRTYRFFPTMGDQFQPPVGMSSNVQIETVCERYSLNELSDEEAFVKLI